MKISNWNIGVRLGLGFAIVLVMLAAVSSLGISRLNQMQDRMRDIAEVNDVEAALAAAMYNTVADRMIALRNVVLLQEEADMRPEAERVRVQAGKYTEAEAKLKAMFDGIPETSPEEKAAFAQIKAHDIAAAPLIQQVLKLGLANDNDKATQVLMHELRDVQRQWYDELNGLVAIENKQNEEALVAASVAYHHALALLLTITGFAIVAGCGIAFYITRGIVRPISNAVQIARTVAVGDLTSEIHVDSTDETGQLLQALKDMNGNLQRIVGEVRLGTETIATASTEIASGNLDLSSRTEQQAGALEETASSMEELTSAVRQNSDYARQASDLAESASTVAGKSGGVVSEAVAKMAEINISSRKIAEIISVIDGIAFQTNILALNAAVEAARAGEQGRGFAVVASEVRNLAQRSASAAKEIKILIEDSVRSVGEGTKLVDQAGVTMWEVVDSIARVTRIMAEISSASAEQTDGIEQVNQAIIQMDAVTQQNAALVEQSAAAAESLQDQARGLSTLVGSFKLESEPAARPSLSNKRRLALAA